MEKVLNLVKLTNLYMSLRGHTATEEHDKSLIELYKTQVASGNGDTIKKQLLECLEQEGVNLI